MNNKPLAILSPLCLCLFAGSARAPNWSRSRSAPARTCSTRATSATPPTRRGRRLDLDDRVQRRRSTSRSGATSCWPRRPSTSIATSTLHSTAIRRATRPPPSSTGAPSATCRARSARDSRRRQYFYGETAEFSFGSAAPTTVRRRNLQTDNHAFARVSLGGQSRWSIFGGADANRRNFSNETFQRQRRAPVVHQPRHALRHQPRPVVRRRRATTSAANIRRAASTADAGPTLQQQVQLARHAPSGRSAATARMDGSLGYTLVIQRRVRDGTRHFVNGSLNWVWTPPSHLTFSLGLKRSADADTPTIGTPTSALKVPAA